MPRDVSSYLAEQQRKSSGETASDWAELEEFYNKKLWHQLTLKLTAFIKTPMFAKGDSLLKLYENFLTDFEHRINPLALTEICILVAKQIPQPKSAVEFIERLKEKVKSSDEAKILCMTTIGNILLGSKDFDNVKVVIEESQGILDGFDCVTSVHSRFYELTSNYHKLLSNHADYYKEALRFLGCVQLADIPNDEQVERAFNLGLAAILGDGVYNFGELLAHDILKSLKNTDKEWLIDLLYTFNSGNIAKFDELKKFWGEQPDLAIAEMQMRQKISLLCLMEMTFQRPATDRQLTFDSVSKTAKIPINEVELLVMKALSLGLVKGHIDEVEQRVHMTWVQPRVLDLEQVSVIQNRLQQWSEDVQQMECLLEVNAHDILT